MKFSYKIFFYLSILISLNSLSTLGNCKNRRKHVKRKFIKKPKKIKFSSDEKKLMQIGGKKLVLRLKSQGYKASDFLTALRNTKGAVQSYMDGRIGDAVFLFNRAFGLVPSPTIKYWIGKAYLKFENYVKSMNAFGTFLKLSKNWTLTKIKKSYLKEAKKLFYDLKLKLVALKVETNIKGTEIAINGEILRKNGKTVKTPLKEFIWLKPGYNYIVFTKKGYVNKEVLIKKGKAGSVIRMKVKLLTPKELIEQSKVFKASEKAKHEQYMKRLAIIKKYEHDRKINEYKAKLSKKSLRLFGYITIGSGTALLLAGGAYALSAYNTSKRMEDLASTGKVDWATLRSEYSKYTKQRGLSYFVTGIGATVLVGGIIITYVGTLEPSVKMKTPLDMLLSNIPLGKKVKVLPFLGPGGGGILFNSTF